MAAQFAHLIYAAIILWLGVRNRNLSKVIKVIKSLPAPEPFVEIVKFTETLTETLTLPPAPGPTPIPPEIPPDFCINPSNAPALIGQSFAPLPNRTNYIVKVYNIIQEMPDNTHIGMAILALCLCICLYLIYYDYRYLSPARRNFSVKERDNCIAITTLAMEQQDGIKVLSDALNATAEEIGSLHKFRDLANGQAWELQQAHDELEHFDEERKAEIAVRLHQQRQKFTAELAETERKYQELLQRKDHTHNEQIQDLQKQIGIWQQRVNNQQPENVIRQATLDTQLSTAKNLDFKQRAQSAEVADQRERRLRLDNDKLRSDNTKLRQRSAVADAARKKSEDETQAFKDDVASRQLQSETFEAILDGIDKLISDNQRLRGRSNAPSNALSPVEFDAHPDQIFSRVETDRGDINAGMNDSHNAVEPIHVRLNSDADSRQVYRRPSDALDITDVEPVANTDETSEDENESEDDDADGTKDDESENDGDEEPDDKPDDTQGDNSDESDDDDFRPGGYVGPGHEQADVDAAVSDNGQDWHGGQNDGAASPPGAPEQSTQQKDDDGDMYNAPKSATLAARTGTAQSRIPRPAPSSAAPNLPANSDVAPDVAEGNDATATIPTALFDTPSRIAPSGLSSVDDSKIRPHRYHRIPNVLAKKDERGVELPRFSRSALSVPEYFEVRRSSDGRVWQWNRTETNHYNKTRNWHETMNKMQSRTQLVWRESGPSTDGRTELRAHFQIHENGQHRVISYEDYLKEHNLVNNGNLQPPSHTPSAPAAATTSRMDRRSANRPQMRNVRAAAQPRPSSSGSASADPQSAGPTPQTYQFTFSQAIPRRASAIPEHIARGPNDKSPAGKSPAGKSPTEKNPTDRNPTDKSPKNK